MDDNFHSEINMEENQHHNKNQQEDYQVFFSTIQINEFDKKMTHNNVLEFPIENHENSFPTYSKLGNSNAKFESIDFIFEKKNNSNNNENSNKNNNFNNNSDFADFNKNSESLFSNIYEENDNFNNNINNNNNINVIINDYSINANFDKENNEENYNYKYENFQMFNNMEEQEMKNQNNENISNDFNIPNANTNKTNRLSCKKLEFDPKQVFSIEDFSSYIIKEKEEKKDLYILIFHLKEFEFFSFYFPKYKIQIKFLINFKSKNSNLFLRSQQIFISKLYNYEFF